MPRGGGGHVGLTYVMCTHCCSDPHLWRFSRPGDRGAPGKYVVGCLPPGQSAIALAVPAAAATAAPAPAVAAAAMPHLTERGAPARHAALHGSATRPFLPVGNSHLPQWRLSPEYVLDGWTVSDLLAGFESGALGTLGPDLGSWLRGAGRAGKRVLKSFWPCAKCAVLAQPSKQAPSIDTACATATISAQCGALPSQCSRCRCLCTKPQPCRLKACRCESRHWWVFGGRPELWVHRQLV